jgi:amidase
VPRLAFCLVATAALAGDAGSAQRSGQPFSVVEAGIPALRDAMASGRTTSRAITEQYLARIARYDATLKATLAINPTALADADARDADRRQGRVRGPLHGVPVALKDNIHAFGMPTTGGALAFATLRVPYEATLARHLRDAGAVIIAKTTMTELANWVSSGMPSGYNAIAGFSLNPYDPRRGPDGRPTLTPGGSSSGIGTAASFWAASVGTETSGSILNPSDETMLVGIKPTVGRLSRHGVIPITADQDTPGPMARTVTDAAIMLGALEGAAPDANDPATRACTPPPRRDYTVFLIRDALRGTRIGVPRAFFAPAASRRGEKPAVRIGRSITLNQTDERLMTDALSALKSAGATVVEAIDLPSLSSGDPARNILEFPICSGTAAASSRNCSSVLRYGMKRDFNRWLTSLGNAAPVRSLSDLRAWNREHEREGALRFGQDQLDVSDAVDLEADRARYQADRARDIQLSKHEGIDAAIRAHRLDALLFPGALGSSIAARAGYPSVIVPFGAVTKAENNTQATVQPFGVTFTGVACTEPRLLALAYAFEQSTRRRVPPRIEDRGDRR